VEARFFPSGTIVPLGPRKAVVADESAARVAAPSAALHDPPLRPRDEAVFLLTAVAEVEHALMVQYLFAAYSVRVPPGPDAAELQKVQNLLLQIAREEMGHLVTVQNLLHLVGGPLNLGRDRAPYASEIYPFTFTLEPVTRESLAKYVTAESPEPDDLPDDMPLEDKALVGQLALDAAAANGGNPINHVGALFARLAVLFGDGAGSLTDADFRTDTATRQAAPDDWGYAPLNLTDGSPLIVASFAGTDAATLRSAARAAVEEIGEQGEGFDLPPGGPGAAESHFERFLDIYKRVDALLDRGVEVTWPLANNPNTTPVPNPTTARNDLFGSRLEALAADGRITEPRARAWAQLFNLRYRMLLGQLAHVLRIDQELYTTADGPRLGDRTARGLLLLGTFDEMRHLRKIAGKLVQLPKDENGAVHAGPPFELPYTLNLPDGERARWRMHVDASRAAGDLLATLLTGDPDPDPFLADLARRDTDRQQALTALANGAEIPATALPTGFAKAVTILDESVRGFRVGGRHGSFWAGKNRDDFVTTPVPPLDLTPVALDQNGQVVPNPAEAPLIERLRAADPRARMPRFRPPVAPQRIAYLERWIREGAPDDVPPGREGVAVEPEPAVEPTGPTTGDVGFATHIVGLFRPGDRAAMIGFFDLFVLEDVREHAEDILGRLTETGSLQMPCDAPWPPGRVALFRRWIEEGMRP
jgi:hypothetical protein